MFNYKQTIGLKGQQIVEKYLVDKGYITLVKNWTCRYGEIDLVMFDNLTKEVVFIEIKTRTTTSFGQPQEAISQEKQLKLAKTIEKYLEKDGICQSKYRIDLIGVYFHQDKRSAKITHIKDVVLQTE